MKTKQEKFDVAPSWKFAVEVYASVLGNNDAPDEAKREAKEELMRLARIVDDLR